jgi:hypothetical protein
MEIYLTRKGQRFGPYTAKWLESFLADGTVSPADLAWTAGRAEWAPVHVLLSELRSKPASLVPAEELSQLALPGAAAVSAEESYANAGQHIPEEYPAAGIDRAISEPDEMPRQTNDGPGEVSSATIPSSHTSPAGAASASAVPHSTHRSYKRPSARAMIAIAAGVVVVSVLTLVAMVPAHVSIRANGNSLLRPDAGYRFVDANDVFSWRVAWTPGTPSATEEHVLAADDEDKWRPAPGYEQRAGAIGGELQWRPGKQEPEYPNVTAGIKPDTWNPYPGYVLADSATPTAPRVAWRQSVQLPHMVSAEREAYWILDAGYEFASDSTHADPRAAWSPGARHNVYSHIYADTEEGVWRPDPGYQMLTSAANDFRAFSPARTREVWQAAEKIDAATHVIDCSFITALSVIAAARDRYAGLATTDIPPALAEHVAAVHAELSSGATTLEGCLVADNAGDGADVAAALGCGVSSLLSKTETWQECMNKTATARKVISAAGKIGSLACTQAVGSFRKNIDQLIIDRQRLQNEFRGAYGIALETPTRIVTCR